jgi:hypothetical protein
MDARQQHETPKTLNATAEQERRLLARTIRLARHEPGAKVPPVVLDAVLIGRLPSGLRTPSVDIT